VSNTTANYFQQEEIRALLTRQVMEPVRFYESIETLILDGFDTFIEIGPGKTLSSFMKKIDKTKVAKRVENIATLTEVLEELG
jgi:[acyl-carrier-protein] S-malonyltransferase